MDSVDLNKVKVVTVMFFRKFAMSPRKGEEQAIKIDVVIVMIKLYWCKFCLHG